MSKKNKQNIVRVNPTSVFPQHNSVKSTMPTKPNNVNDVKQVASFIASIVRYNRSMWKQELADFQMARASAMNVDYPRRYYLYQIYRDIRLDMFFRGQINQRINRVKNKKRKIVKADGTKDEEKTKLFQSAWFRKLVQFAMEAKFNGHSLPYFFYDQYGRFQCKKTYIENVVPEKNLILKNPFDVDGVRYDEAPFVNVCISVGDPEDLGLYESLAIGYILKKHSWQSWDEFEEMFGIPVRIAKTASEDKAVQSEILQWLEDMGSASYGLFPLDTEIDIKESKQTDAFEVFNQKRKAINEEAAILINGQQESSNNTGSRAKTEALIINTTDQITDDDKEDIAELINDDLIPRLINVFGFPLDEGDRFEWDDAKQLRPEELKDMAEAMKKIDEMGFELDATDISQKTGFKILGKKEEVKTEPPAPDPNQKKKPLSKADKLFVNHLKMHHDIVSLLIDQHDHAEQEA